MDLMVYFDQEPIGHLTQDAKKQLVFSYETHWQKNPLALPLSLQLPLDRNRFDKDQARPFFSGLLPEAEIRRRLCKKIGISEGNDLGLLAEIGGECAGAVSVWPCDTRPDFSASYKPLSLSQLQKKMASRALHPLLYDPQGLRLSLAGAQEKTALYLSQGKFYRPLGMAPSSHIIKPEIPGCESTVANEAFCLMLASHVGLSVPNVQIIKVEFPILAVQRYDRVLKDDKLIRIHQEDFCQALGVLPQFKYESEDGPTLAQCFTLLSQYSAVAARDRLQLLQAVIFNHLIGNADAHAKNFSLLIQKDGIRLAPFYDLLSTQIYPELNAKSAMKIGGENRPDWILQRHWERLAGEAGMNPRLFLKTTQDFAHHVSQTAKNFALEFLHSHGFETVIKKILRVIQKRLRGFE